MTKAIGARRVVADESLSLTAAIVTQIGGRAAFSTSELRNHGAESRFIILIRSGHIGMPPDLGFLVVDNRLVVISFLHLDICTNKIIKCVLIVLHVILRYDLRIKMIELLGSRICGRMITFSQYLLCCLILLDCFQVRW